MKLQLIMTEPPIVVSDEDTSLGGVLYDYEQNIIQNVSRFNVTDFHKKIIAGLPELPSIDFSLIPEEKLKEIGYVDVEKLALKECQYNHKTVNEIGFRLGFEEGFNLANQLNNNKYSEEDIKEALRLFAIEAGSVDGLVDVVLPASCYKWIDNYIQSLKQPRVYDIEVEMEQKKFKTGIEDNGVKEECYEFPEPKITNNSIKVTKIL